MMNCRIGNNNTKNSNPQEHNYTYNASKNVITIRRIQILKNGLVNRNLKY